MSIQVGRSLGVARTVVRIVFLVKECCVLSMVKDTVPCNMHRKQSQAWGKDKARFGNKSSLIDKPDVCCSNE